MSPPSSPGGGIDGFVAGQSRRRLGGPKRPPKGSLSKYADTDMDRSWSRSYSWGHPQLPLSGPIFCLPPRSGLERALCSNGHDAPPDLSLAPPPGHDDILRPAARRQSDARAFPPSPTGPASVEPSPRRTRARAPGPPLIHDSIEGSGGLAVGGAGASAS